MFFFNAKDAKKGNKRKGRKGIFSQYSIPITHYLFLVAILLFSECAQIVMPNGGTKDTTPPKVVKYMPDSAATNFKGKEINIVFNEYVQLKNVNDQLIVSPLLDEQPEIKLVKNHILNIEFKKALKENTTYTMNFGNSIVDYNEGNEVDNFQYVFSTGSFIDSLSLSGKVQHAFDHKTEKGILVMLYDASTFSDSTPYKTQPSYFSKTKADGTYKINNIRSGKYKLFALRDENRNYKYDESEIIGFQDQEVEINKNTLVDVEVFKEVPKKLKMLSAKAVDYGHIVIVLNRSVNYPSIKALNVSKIPTEILDVSKTEDSLNYWFEGVMADSLKLEVSDSRKIIDTVEIRLITKEQAVKIDKDKFKLEVKSNIVPGQSFAPNKEFLFKFNHLVNKDNILFPNGILKRGKDSLDYEVVFDQERTTKDSNYYHSFTIKPDILSMSKDSIKYYSENHLAFLPGVKYSVFVPPGQLKDIFGLKNDTFKIEFKTQELKYYGTLKLKLVREPKIVFIPQLLDSKENIVKEEIVYDNTTFNYDYLDPGNYKLKLIYDIDRDNKWTPGDYVTKRQAEKVIYYEKPIVVRSNWDLELEWKIN